MGHALNRRLKHLEQAAEAEIISIAQNDGSTVRFPAGSGIKAFMNVMARLGADEDAPPEHPLIAAARNSPDPKWNGSFFAINDPDKWVEPIEDLSVGAPEKSEEEGH